MNIPISGTVIASQNTSHAFAGVPVRLYNSDESDSQLDLVASTTTSSSGEYFFNAPHSRRYQVCAFTYGYESCIHYVAPNITSGGRHRRLYDWSRAPIPVSVIASPYEYEVQLIWVCDSSSAASDWDTELVTSFRGNCIAGPKEGYRPFHLLF